MIEIAASTLVAAPRALVFEFLAERDNHWHLAGPSVTLLHMGQEADGRLTGLVLIRGPFGLRRRARTRVLSVHEPALLGGVAELGGRTTADVRWDLHEVAGEGTRVRLSASVSSVGPLDRLLLAVGGTLWMRRLFASTLRLLAERLHAAEPALQAA